MFIADDNYTEEPDSAEWEIGSDAFTQLKMLNSADEKKASAKKSHYDVAIINTGAANGSADAVSVLGGDDVDDSGIAIAMLSAVQDVSENASVLAVKAFDKNGAGTVSSVYAAMVYAVEQDVDVIDTVAVLSLG